MGAPTRERVTLETLRQHAARGTRFSMLTAYDYPTAVAAERAGVHALLIGDSMGNVVLGQESTRAVPLELMITLGAAVRRGAPSVYLVGDLPHVAVRGGLAAVRDASRRFVEECGCDAVKLEAEPHHAPWIENLAGAGHTVIAHLGLRPQLAVDRSELRAQARDAEGIAALVADARALVAAGAGLLLLEAVPNEASAAVCAAVPVPVIGCGAGPACHGHVVVTHDMLGIGDGPPPRFVKVLADLRERTEAAMRTYVAEIADGRYPGPEHTYGLRKPAATHG